jgi:hypothetical protein
MDRRPHVAAGAAHTRLKFHVGLHGGLFEAPLLQEAAFMQVVRARVAAGGGKARPEWDRAALVEQWEGTTSVVK